VQLSPVSIPFITFIPVKKIRGYLCSSVAKFLLLKLAFIRVNSRAKKSLMNKILIACLGNIFYGDDGFGVEVANELLKKKLPENIKVVDFGICGVDLAFELAEEYELVILVDTIKVGAKAGSVFVLEPKMNGGQNEEMSHDLTPVKAMQLAQSLNAKPKKMLLVACEPVNLEFNDEMSEAVKKAVGKAVLKVLEIVNDVRKY
jgi:hydrogenase maturation protease